MNESDFKNLLSRGSKTFQSINNPTRDSRPPTKLESTLSNEPLATSQAKDENSRRCTIRYLNIRRRLLDSENLATKYHTDAMRYFGILKDDTYEMLKVEPDQRKAKKGEEEKIIITIEIPTT